MRARQLVQVQTLLAQCGYRCEQWEPVDLFATIARSISGLCRGHDSLAIPAALDGG